jgi:hypothetical protein
MAWTTMNACRKCEAIISGANGVFVSWKTIATMSLPANTDSPVSLSLLSEREISICASGLFVFLHAGLFVARAGADRIDLGMEKCVRPVAFRNAMETFCSKESQDAA